MTIEFEHATLPNGLTVIGEIDPTAHTAAIGFFVKTGARDEAPAAMGVSHFLEHMMFKGTDVRTAEQVDRDFDEIGANHNAFTTAELTAFWAHTLPEHADRATEILADIMRPALRPEDFEDEKGVILEEIAMYDDQPFWVLYEKAMEVYYGTHPLSHRVLGTKETIAPMTRDAMDEYFRDRYAADNTSVVLTGRVDFDALVARLGALCGDWVPSGAARTYPGVAPSEESFDLRTSRVARHYQIMIAPAPALQDGRRYASAMLGQILGDVEGSRLYWALVETGLADEAQAQYHGRDGCGESLVYFSCSPEDAEAVEAATLAEIDALVDSLAEDDLERERNKIATGVTLQAELPAGRLRGLGRVWTCTGEYRSLDEELARLDAVTLDDLRAVAADFPLRPRVIGRLAPA